MTSPTRIISQDARSGQKTDGSYAIRMVDRTTVVRGNGDQVLINSSLPIDVAIRTVSDSLEKVDGEDHRILASQLAQLLRIAGRDTEALQVLDEMMQRYPDDVRPAISKAALYSYSLEHPEEALRSRGRTAEIRASG